MASGKKTAVVGDYSSDQARKWTRFFVCDCGNSWEMVSYCDWQFCPKCQNKVWDMGLVKGDEIRRKPLTAAEARKLSWYKDERKWIEDIGKRRALPNGDVAIVDHKGRIEEVRKRNES